MHIKVYEQFFFRRGFKNVYNTFILAILHNGGEVNGIHNILLGKLVFLDNSNFFYEQRDN
ncbi:hypothetical protein GCM10011351_05770 [Paraliobacillus quinghaiensis]|uniref:Uncharacterized protein n=1 Tax=Paraliobacillus quinghaiensis TaxID=470815 RepID=A0A917THP7_9BACI|nr:hypothetical protein GCM10011351_05770 [Paraliobacillus quinghaiensis]